eukprot:GHVR01145256.1.p1 GENE.GHVR01145256.1~~GHVR01145256.1.p1  ORF type:complete len:153 (-),score=21.07 GHVR01145256.1:245-703(-)
MFNASPIKHLNNTDDTDHKRPLVMTRQFDKFMFINVQDDDFTVPIGPSVFYEMALYLAIHIGCKEIYGVGLDNIVGRHTATYTHFYEGNEPDMVEESKSAKVTTVECQRMAEAFPDTLAWLNSMSVQFQHLQVEGIPSSVPQFTMEQLVCSK